MITPSISPKASKNYLSKIFLLKESMISKHPNADRLSIVTVDYTPIISNNPQPNIWYVYFPTESQINADFLKTTNSYRKTEMNLDPNATPGFFEANGRVKTVKLRGEYSTGYIVPLSSIESFLGEEVEKKETYFDMLGNFQLSKKYRKPFEHREQVQGLSKDDKKATKLNIVEGQFKFHDSTDNLRKEMHNIYPDDIINISYKLHGTSHICANLLFSKEILPKWYQKLLGIKPKTEPYYNYVTSSRKVIKSNPDLKDLGYYKEDIWTHASESFKERIPKGWTIYSEIVGYLPSGAMIQKDYDYGCKPQTYKIMPYRITVTNEDGDVMEMSSDQIIEWSKKNGLEPMVSFYTGTVENHYLQIFKNFEDLNILAELKTVKENEGIYSEQYKEVLERFRIGYLHALEAEYNEKDCFICKNKVPEEGIIIRKLKDPSKFIAYKLKSRAFLMKESVEADKGTTDIEEEQAGDVV